MRSLTGPLCGQPPAESRTREIRTCGSAGGETGSTGLLGPDLLLRAARAPAPKRSP